LEFLTLDIFDLFDFDRLDILISRSQELKIPALEIKNKRLTLVYHRLVHDAVSE